MADYTLVTDPDLISQLNAAEAGQAVPAGAKLVTDPDALLKARIAENPNGSAMDHVQDYLRDLAAQTGLKGPAPNPTPPPPAPAPTPATFDPDTGMATASPDDMSNPTPVKEALQRGLADPGIQKALLLTNFLSGRPGMVPRGPTPDDLNFGPQYTPTTPPTPAALEGVDLSNRLVVQPGTLTSAQERTMRRAFGPRTAPLLEQPEPPGAPPEEPSKLDYTEPTRDQIAGASQRQGVPVPVAAATDSASARMVAAAVKEVPIANAPLVQASADSLNAAQARLGKVADDFSMAPGSAPYLVRQGVRNWVQEGSRAEDNDIYGQLRGLMRVQQRPTPLNQTADMVNQLQAEMAESTGQAARTAIARVEEAASDPQGLTFDGLKNLRREIGELGSKSDLDTNYSRDALDRIYGALTRDMRNNLAGNARSGVSQRQILQAFDNANAAHQRILQIRRDLTDITGVDYDAAPADIISRIRDMASGRGAPDIQRLINVRKAVGEDAWDALSSNIVRQLGRTPEGFSWARYIREYNNMSEGGKQVLFQSTENGRAGNLKQSLDDLAILGAGSKRLEAFANHSGSGRMAAIIGMLMSWEIHPSILAGELAGGASAWTLAKALARPATVRAYADAQTAAQSVLRAPNNQSITTYTAAQKALADGLRQIGIEPDEKDKRKPEVPPEVTDALKRAGVQAGRMPSGVPLSQ